ncbi:MAG: insulinase family protein [Marinilabiliaceae bacterium]|nr:insulinase family protein [Marinilabiliaceae bacterium]
MIEIQRHILNNGLKVLVHTDKSTPLAAVNLLYNIGSKDESPNQTGFAHLFEHLMFGGSKHIANFDAPLQLVGGDNNAFTTNDITNYYETLPANNIETAFWLESDRMLELDFSQNNLDVQKNVVTEEFKQRYLNQPYGDLPLLFRPLAYKHHPYQWPTIGKTIDHIQQATLNDVKDFFYKHYAPNNAILCVSGNVNANEIFKLAEKWFSQIPQRKVPVRKLIQEPQQTESRFLEVERDVPANLIQMAFHMNERTHESYHATDLLSDILSNGNSSRLYQSLIKEQQLFAEINAYITGDDDPGLLIVRGRPSDGVSLEIANKAIWNELEKVCSDPVSDYELQKVKNKVESSLIYSEISFLNKAMTLSHFELQTKADDINLEAEKYEKVTSIQIQNIANQILLPTNCSTVLYKSKLN